MQIPRGDSFGNRLPKLGQTNIGNVGAGVGDAMGKAVSGAIEHIKAENKAIDEVKASAAILEAKNKISAFRDEAALKLENNEIAFEAIKPQYEQFIQQLEMPTLGWLDAVGKEKYKLATDTMLAEERKNTAVFYNELRKNQGRVAVQAQSTKINELALKPDVDFSLLQAMLNDESFQTAGKVAFGEAWTDESKKIQYGLHINYVDGQIRYSADNKDTETLYQIKERLLSDDNPFGLTKPDRLNRVKKLEPIINLSVSQHYVKNVLTPIQRMVEKTGSLDSSAQYAALLLRRSQESRVTVDNQLPASDSSGIGMSQISYTTAQHVANTLDIAFDKKRFDNDPQYNMQLGQAYFEQCLDQYGTPSLALVAYSVGDEKMQTYLKTLGDPSKGTLSEEAFIAKIPDKKLVKQLTESFDNARNTKNSPLLKAQLAAIDNNHTLNAEQKSYAKADLSKQIEALQKAQKQAYNANYQSLWRDLTINQIPITEIGAERLSHLTEKDRLALMENKAEPKLDLSLWSEARGRIKAGDEVNVLSEYIGKLSSKSLDTLLTMQQELQSNPEKQAHLATMATLIKDRVAQFEIDNQKVTHELIDAISDDIQKIQLSQPNKQLTKQQMLEITDKYIAPEKKRLAIEEYRVLLNKQYQGISKDETITIEQIPKSLLTQITSELTQNQIPTTHKNIIKCYKEIDNGV